VPDSVKGWLKSDHRASPQIKTRESLYELTL